MKKRTLGFLRDEHIGHDSEQFDYIAELHEYLWRFVRTEIPGAYGNIRHYLGAAIEAAEDRTAGEA